MGDVCHWRHAYLFDNVIRRLVHNLQTMYRPYVQPGMIVLDVGCGMGFNAIGLAKLVGETGTVIATDVQPEMLQVLRRRAGKAGVAERIRTRQCRPDAIGVTEAVDFAVAFWMVHEVPNPRALLRELGGQLTTGGHLFIAEPRLHVSATAFDQTLTLAEEVGLTLKDRPSVRFSRAAVFTVA